MSGQRDTHPMAAAARALLPLLAGALLLPGCQTPPPPGEPALPVGFRSAPLPQVPLDLYVFARPPAPLALPTSYLKGKDAAAGLPERLLLASAAAWAGPSPDSFGATLTFADAAHAEAAALLLDRLGSPWQKRNGRTVAIVSGGDPWAVEARGAVEQGRTMSLEAAYPEAWALLRELPRDPPDPPVAAGFLMVGNGLVDALASRYGRDAERLTAALAAAKVDGVAFAVYAEEELELPEALGPGYLEEMGAQVMVVARSTYPGLLVGFSFGGVASQAGMERVTVGGVEAYHAAVEGGHLLMRHKGNLIFVAAAPTRERAEALLSSAP